MRLAGRLFAPGIRALGSVRRTVCGAMPLGFRRQLFASPACEGRCFRVAHVNRPGRRKRNRSKHPAILPVRLPIGCRGARAPHPEMRMIEPPAAPPFPVLGLPVRRIVVSASLNKFQDIARWSPETRRSKNSARRFCARQIRCPSQTRRLGAAVRAWRRPPGSSLAAVRGAGLGSGDGPPCGVFRSTGRL